MCISHFGKLGKAFLTDSVQKELRALLVWVSAALFNFLALSQWDFSADATVEAPEFRRRPLVRSASCPKKIDHTSGLTLHSGYNLV